MTKEQPKTDQTGEPPEPRRFPIPLAERRRLLEKVLKRDETTPAIKDWASI